MTDGVMECPSPWADACVNKPASVSSFLSAITTIQSFSMAMVLATVARLAIAPRKITRAERKMKRGREGLSHIPISRPNMRASPTAHRHTSPF